LFSICYIFHDIPLKREDESRQPTELEYPQVFLGGWAVLGADARITRGSPQVANVLIVDDDVDTLELATMVLTRAGHTVTPVGRGLEALAEAAKDRPDVILLDIMLPDMDGFSVARKLRAATADSPPILFFSALNSPEDQATGRTLGDGYLLKPVRTNTLIESVHKALEADKPRGAVADKPLAT
jgi:two-component system OmpR family response regulator